jgi:hypothetical protein
MSFAAVVAQSDDAIVVADARALDAPDLGTVDALARLALGARRRGRVTIVRSAPPELRALLELAGLAGVVVCDGQSTRGGRPKSGKSRPVPRKNVSSTIRPPSSSSTWSAHGS